MSLPKCSEEEFIRLWRELKSGAEVSRHLQMSVRACLARRQNIERMRGISLQSMDPRATPERRVQVLHDSAVVKVQITDGTVLIGSDAHIWPGPRTTMQRAFLMMAKKLQPAAVIANGDFTDMATVSRWPALSWQDRGSKPSVAAEIEAVQDYLGDLEKAAPSAYRAWPFGNHDQRFAARLISAAPEYEGVAGTKLKDHFPGWEPCWRVDINDNVIVRHRELGGEHADYRNTLTTGMTMVTGHDHRTGVTPFRSYRGVSYGVRCGYMCDSAQDPQFVEYLEGRSPNWHPAFVILSFVGGELLYPELCTKHDDSRVVWRGELIEV